MFGVQVILGFPPIYFHKKSLNSDGHSTI